MYISYVKLERAGYEVHTKKTGVDIVPKHPLEIDFDAIREVMHSAGLTQKEIDHGLDAMVIEVETLQIMDAIR